MRSAAPVQAYSVSRAPLFSACYNLYMPQTDPAPSACVRQNLFAFEQFIRCVKVNVKMHHSSDQQYLEPSYWILLLCLLDFQLHMFTASLPWNTGFLTVPSSPIWVPIRSSKHVTHERFFPSAPGVSDIPGVVGELRGNQEKQSLETKITLVAKSFSKLLKSFNLESCSSQINKML